MTDEEPDDEEPTGEPPEPWRTEFTRPAEKDLKRLDRPIRERVTAALRELEADPVNAPLVKLTGKDQHRLRVGDWRVRLRLDTDERAVYVLRVLPRGRAYDR